MRLNFAPDQSGTARPIASRSALRRVDQPSVAAGFRARSVSNPLIRHALATPDKDYLGIEGATHYYLGQPGQLKQCTDRIIEWSRRHAL